MKSLLKGLATAALALFIVADSAPVLAQSSVTEMLEQARARARDIEELKAVFNGPDQNMRLATFEIMANSGDEVMRQVAIDMALASTDPLMQGMAFKESILSLDRIILSLEIDKSQPKKVQDRAQIILDSTGSRYTILLTEQDRTTGTFKIKRAVGGQVNGTVLTFKSGNDDGTLTLVDETTIKGSMRIYKGGYAVFNVTATFR